MQRRRRALLAALTALLVLGTAVATVSGYTQAAFSGMTSSGAAGVATDTDWTPPDAARSVTGKSAGGDAGFVRQGGTYYTYAQVTDGGNPPSGVASVSADAGLGPIALAAGSWTVQGLTYNRRSALQTAPGTIPEGTYPFTVASSDSDSPANSQTQSGFNVTVDNTAPNPADVQTANSGSIVGRPELADTVTFSWNEPIEPVSILAGWDGSSTNVVVRINDTNPDRLQVYNSANTAQLALTNAAGLNLNRNDYVGANRTFGAGGTASTMVRIGNSVRITLGTQSGAGTTAVGNGTMSWTASGTVTDRAGNPSTIAAVNELGTADMEF